MDDPSFVLKENYSLYLVCFCIPCSPLFCMLQNEVWVEITEDEYVRCGAMFDRLNGEEWEWFILLKIDETKNEKSETLQYFSPRIASL